MKWMTQAQMIKSADGKLILIKYLQTFWQSFSNYQAKMQAFFSASLFKSKDFLLFS